MSNRRFMDLEVVLATASVGALLAMAYLRAGARTDALVAFRKVLNAGQHVGLYQTILDQGPEIGALLLSVRTRRQVRKILPISRLTSTALSRVMGRAINLKSRRV